MRLLNARRTIAVLALTVTLLCSSVAYSQESASEELVWHWFGSCNHAKTMTVDVVLGGKRLFKSAFPICVIDRSDNQSGHDNLRFLFKAPARIFGDEFASLGAPELEGSIWEAGGERDAILLGVSFKTKGRILLNTIHVASTNKATQSELGERLVMKTIVQPTK
jgi:hypothetical protein